MKKMFLGLFVTLVGLFIYGNVNAATVTVKIPKVVVNAPAGTSDNYYVTLEAKDQDNPMPGSESKKKTIIVRSNSEGEFGSLTFNEAGYYYYKIYQTKPTLSNIKYDKHVYEYVVQIYTEEGGVLRDSVSLKNGSSSNKLDVITFSNLAKGSARDSEKSSPGKNRKGVNPYTADNIIKYFIIAVISIVVILILIIYVKNSRDDN